MEYQALHIRLICITLLLTICLGIPRFAHHTPDSRHYVNLARYFQNDLPQEQLLKPYASRVLIPFLSTLMPIDNINTSIAVINIIVTAAAYLLFISYMKLLGMSALNIRAGTLILVISFPTFNYSSGVLTDPAGFLAFILGIYLLFKDKYILLSLTACLGILVRESLLLLVLIAVIDILGRNFFQPDGRQHWKNVTIKLLIISIPPLMTFFIAKSYLFPALPTNFSWGISFDGLMNNLRESKMGWLTFPLTLFPPLALILYGIRQNGLGRIREVPLRIKLFLSAISIVSILYIIYSNCIPTAYMSGRFVWPFYSVLIPVSVILIQDTPLFTEWFAPISNKIFGKYPDEN